ncbi:MAG: hypothetical protein ACQEXJ_21080 [Myxococcota bacterium]
MMRLWNSGFASKRGLSQVVADLQTHCQAHVRTSQDGIAAPLVAVSLPSNQDIVFLLPDLDDLAFGDVMELFESTDGPDSDRFADVAAVTRPATYNARLPLEGRNQTTLATSGARQGTVRLAK